MRTDLPNLIIIGVRKAATTSLFRYLKQHPEIYGSTIKELHYFTPLIQEKPLSAIEDYARHYKKNKGEKYLLEGSPMYFYGKSRIIDVMQSILPHHKVILILRKPGDRLISFFNMLKSQYLISGEETLKQFTEKCKDVYKDVKGNPFSSNKSPYHNALVEGKYAEFIIPWIERYGDDLKIIDFDELVNETERVLYKIFNWLRIDTHVANSLKLSIENRTFFGKNKTLHKTAVRINRYFESFFNSYPSIKQFVRVFYHKLNKNSQIDLIDEKDKIVLDNYYKYSDDILREILNEYNMDLPKWLCREM